ncbi:hypothetical protein [Nocardioides sp. AX2bis]|uniref:hypothetical protein n=1 Tax=Nocardioides sp. AX2bis TaxID=2653157 RepID=UPI0012F3644C|nr:hypothetical protein [Nocardioides sp. AX2bis]VXC28331.1 conserved membrane hypothetical protein [Nocardioides sp. AX2bis]
MHPLSLASLVGHTLHYGLLVVGFAGVGALVLGSTRSPSPAARAALVTVGGSSDPRLGRRGAEVPATVATRPALWPVAVVSSAAAAGVHAAMGPAHATESPLLGLLFVVAATAQLAWAGVALLRPVTGPRAASLAAAGLVLQGTVLAAWALSRTVGLPGLEGPEPVGPWDAAAVVWQLVASAACLWVIAAGGVRPLASGTAWHRGAVAWAGLSVLALPLLVLVTVRTGGGA